MLIFIFIMLDSPARNSITKWTLRNILFQNFLLKSVHEIPSGILVLSDLKVLCMTLQTNKGGRKKEIAGHFVHKEELRADRSLREWYRPELRPQRVIQPTILAPLIAPHKLWRDNQASKPRQAKRAVRGYAQTTL